MGSAAAVFIFAISFLMMESVEMQNARLESPVIILSKKLYLKRNTDILLVSKYLSSKYVTNETVKNSKDCENSVDWKVECPNIVKNWGARVCISNNPHFQEVAKNCKKSCNLCPGQGRSAAPTLSCERTRYGCCWDRKTVREGFNNEGCPRCLDDYPHVCHEFRFLCDYRSKHAESFHVSCPVSCGQCTPKLMGGVDRTKHETLIGTAKTKEEERGQRGIEETDDHKTIRVFCDINFGLRDPLSPFERGVALTPSLSPIKYNRSVIGRTGICF
ncbi:predicted protein [Nematostella vectensis]|uniref:ShKT domain-containing protein n=1 Tax=Nematostella vectensis TaxID=45351 RepID=A7S8T6_NEMVE|nr:predicted protein [Nematostella vectensis]|eukprot:XP_001631949.1 predicted protein [Nematostella vectensis]